MKVSNNKISIMKVNINAELPRKIPVKPPEINILTKPIEYNIPGVNRIFPLHKVVNQLNTLIAEGTAIISVSSTKNEPRNGLILIQTCGAPIQEMQVQQ
jgi:hypothetical protein